MDSAVDQKKSEVVKWIDEHTTEMLDFFMDSIRYKSISGDELSIQRDFFEPFLKKTGWSKVDIFSIDREKERPNINAVWDGAGGGRSLLLNGHVDVVDVPEVQLSRWTRDPWSPSREGEYIFGRGANDMKGGLSAMIWAVKALIENEVDLQGTLAMELVVGEELMHHEVGTTAATKRLLDQGYAFSFSVIPEPTDCEIQAISAGTFDFDVSVTGKEIHTAMRNLVLHPQRFGLPSGEMVGVDAVSRLIDILKLFEKLERDWAHRYRHNVIGSGGYPMHEDAQGVGCFTINPSFVKAGSYISSVPGNATATCQVYHPPWVRYEEVAAEIRRVVEAYASTDDWLKNHPPEVSVGKRFVWPPYETDINHEGCRILAKAYEHATRRPAQFSGLKAVDDQTFISALGIPGVSMGPGNILMGGHGPDERIPIKQIPMIAKTLALFIMEWCGLE